MLISLLPHCQSGRSPSLGLGPFVSVRRRLALALSSLGFQHAFRRKEANILEFMRMGVSFVCLIVVQMDSSFSSKEDEREKEKGEERETFFLFF